MPAGAFAFELADQHAFARLSGDFNPIHVDPAAARRELFGEVVAHGIHVLLRALECLLAAVRPPGDLHLDALACRFQNPVFLGREHRVRILDATADRARVEVRGHDGALALAAEVRWTVGRPTGALRPGALRPGALGPGALHEFAAPTDRSLGALRELSGESELGFEMTAFAERFPALASHVDALDLAQVLALTRIVGMECPGLQSIFADFEVARHDAATTALRTSGPRIAFRTEGVDERLPRVRFTVSGPSLAGKVTTFVRPRAQAQPSAREVSERVPAGAYAGERAVILGGSRGIGEVTAKIIAAGGGRPWLSYRSGREDAEAIRDDIRSVGFACEIFEFDALDPRISAQPSGFADIGSLYYFASPKISKRRGSFDWQVFEHYCGFYVRGFLDAVQYFRAAAPDGLRVFYPSSTMVANHDAGFMEYVAAKQAGESVCGHLNRHSARSGHSGLSATVSIHVARLPRLATDQTLSLIPSVRTPVLDAMIGVVHTMQSSQPPAAK